MLPNYLIPNHQHVGQAQHQNGVAVWNDPSQLDKTPWLDGSPHGDPPPHFRVHRATKTSRLGFIRRRLQRMAVFYREGKLRPTTSGRILPGRFRAHDSRRQHLVHSIALDIELPCYTCRCCSWSESPTWRRRNSSIVSKGIWKLFSILSGCTLVTQKGLALELSAHSPSDSHHWFKNYRLGSGRVSDTEDDRLFNDPKNGRRNA